MKKIFLFLLLLFCITLFFNYHADIPLATIQKKYELPHSNYVQIQGMEVHYAIEGDGPVLLLLHGTGSSLHTWEGWTQRMKDQYQIIRLDLPGFGLTGPHPKNQYTNEAYISFLHDFVSQLGLTKFHIGGNSFGGYLSWLYTLNHPNKVNRLILLDASGYPRPADAPLPLGFKLASNPIIAPLMDKFTPRYLVEKTVYDSYENDDLVTDAAKERYFDLLLRKGNRKGLTERIRQIKHTDWQRISEIQQQTLVIWGDKDAVVSPGDAQRFHDDLPNDELLIYPNVGHIPMEEIPEQSAKDVLRFLGE